MPGQIEKVYQYQTIVIVDRGHLTDPKFLAALNVEGAKGWKHREEQVMGASKLAILMEREVVLSEPIKCDPKENRGHAVELEEEVIG